MKNYEAVIILKAESDEEIKKSAESAMETIKKNECRILNEENWGKRANSYLVKKEKEGVYLKLNFSADPKAIKVIEAAYKLNQKILRVMITRRDNPPKKEGE